MAQTNSETSGYVRWEAPGLPAVVIRRTIAEDIHVEVLRGLNAVPKRGAETGGLLLGRRAGNEVHVESFEPLTCEHRFGPSFRLSDADRKVLEGMLRQLEAAPPEGLAVVGFYRSHTRPDFSLDDEDAALMAEYFSDPSQVLLLIKPNRWQQSVADFSFWSDGQLRQALHQEAFPFEREGVPAMEAVAEPVLERVAEAVPQPTLQPAAPEPKAEARPALAPLPPLDSLRTRGRKPPEPPRHSWIWGAFAAVIAILAGAFVYQTYYKPANSADRHSAAQPDAEQTPDVTAARQPATGESSEPQGPAAQPPAAAPPAPGASSPTPAKAAPEATPPVPGASTPPRTETAAVHEPPAGSVPAAAPAAPPEPAVSSRKEPGARREVARGGSQRTDISTLLNRWAGSIRSGDARSLARFYAPRISPYYARRSARPADTRQHLEYLRGRYGRLAIYRITGLSIAPVSANMAFATVTKHWETAGPRKQAGEERQRITLVRTDEGWKIAGEEEPRVSWVHRDRPR